MEENEGEKTRKAEIGKAEFMAVVEAWRVLGYQLANSFSQPERHD